MPTCQRNYSVSTFKKEYDVQASAVITNALVMVADELKEGAEFPPCVYTENAAWDTGAEITIISPRLVETLGLVPHNKGEFMGIGGDQTVSTYMVHIGLANGKMIYNEEVYCSDIDDSLLRCYQKSAKTSLSRPGSSKTLKIVSYLRPRHSICLSLRPATFGSGLCRGIFVKHCNFFSAIAITLRNISYLCAQKRAKLGGASTIGTSSIAFGLHEFCGEK